MPSLVGFLSTIGGKTVKIVGDQRHCLPNKSKWTLLASYFDIDKQKTYGEPFPIEEKDVQTLHQLR